MDLQTDVLIIGGGGAACRAAIEAADNGVNVVMVSKKPPEKAGATSFPVAEMAGYNAGNPRILGDIEKHYEDIIKAGEGMADPELARILAENAPETISFLEDWGVKFENEDDNYYIFKSCFSETPRTHVIRGHGEPIIRALMNQINKRSAIKIISNVTITGLLMDHERCAGAFGWNTEGENIMIYAGAVIMATGGTSQAFLRNLNPGDVSGDGYTMGHEAGAELINMEFMQIGMGFSHPIVNIFNGYIWEGKPKLLNGRKEEFLSAYLPEGLTADEVMHEHRRHFPFTTSDNSKYIETSIHREISEGRGTEHGGIIADLTHMTDDYVQTLKDDCGIHHMWTIARDYMLKRGVDLLKEPVELSVFAHATSGGLKINQKANTSIPGLYAAGETAGGPHGANRLGGNMMVTCQVFGAIAGRNAAIWANEHTFKKLDKKLNQENLHKKSELLLKSIDADEMIHRLQVQNQKNLLLNRNEDKLNETLQLVERLRKEIEAAGLQERVNLRNYKLYSLLSATEMMALSAKKRKESRGSHYREDYPQKDDMFNSPYVY